MTQEVTRTGTREAGGFKRRPTQKGVTPRAPANGLQAGKALKHNTIGRPGQTEIILPGHCNGSAP